MEFQLHRQLKQIYAGETAQQEVRVDGYRIDAVRGKTLIEIQVASLSAIRRKIERLLQSHSILLVKPIVIGKRIVKLDQQNGVIVNERASPFRGSILDLFHELVYFGNVFPHPRLRIEAPLVTTIETRYPGHGRRRRWRKNDFQLAEVTLNEIHDTHCFRNASDLSRLCQLRAGERFDTARIAESLKIDRWFAQRIAYVLRNTQAAIPVGKNGNSILYQVKTTRRKAA